MIMKLFPVLAVALLMAAALGGNIASAEQKAASSRTIAPIVSADWVWQNSDNDNMVIIDIRDPKSFAADHIPGSVNEPFATAFDPCTGPTSNWIVSGADCLWLEMPEPAALEKTVGALGIKADSPVVIVTAPNPEEPPFFGLANATRVADTLIYCGVKNVGILNGGYPGWAAEGRPLTPAPFTRKPAKFQAQADDSMLVSAEYVHQHLDDAIIIDARDQAVYSGEVVEPFAAKPGHIPGARSLPAPAIWDQNENGAYTYKSPEALAELAAAAVGGPPDAVNKEIIVYCGVGGYGSTLWFVLTQVLGYQNVKLFDGSAQAWVKQYDMVTE